MPVYQDTDALHLDVLSAIPGRLRVQFERPIEAHLHFAHIQGVTECRYNPRIQTLTCRYDESMISEEKLIIQLGAIYVSLCSGKLLHVKRCEEEGFSMAPSGYLALGCIGLDGLLTLTGSALTGFTRWLSAGATMAAVVEHGYQELHVRGSFDPEVMSVFYLLNSLGKPNGLQASMLAWIVTFGRHLIHRAPREQAYLARRDGSRVTPTGVKNGESQARFAGRMLQRSVEMMARKS